MNRVFRTTWSDVHQQYVVVNEKQPGKGKASKSVVALAVASALMLGAATSSAAYIEAGKLGQTTSWESDEYKGDWGLTSINASVAYAMGINGSSVKVGVVDSGTALHHNEMQGDRWHSVTTTGKYSHTGTRYPNQNGPATSSKFPAGNSEYDNYFAGQDFSIGGEYIHGVSDQHGTHVSGTIGANRDGIGMHGVAWGAQMYVANTGGYDSMTYGPNQDYGYFKAAYTALLDQGVRIINQSWGSNRNHGYPGATGNNTKPGGVIDWNTTMPTLADCEQAWYHFDQIGHKTFVDAASELALENDVIFVWTNGNGSNKSPYTRALLPYFTPEIESQWLAVAMSNPPVESNNGLTSWSGKAGYAKWWTITAPGNGVNSSIVDMNTGLTVDKDGNPLYGEKSGTSMAAPYASGALALVMDRYGYLTASQARDVLLTTATTEQGGKVMTETPDVGAGWGFVNMDTAMFGPGQFLGKFHVVMNGVDDTWANNISDKALDTRKTEDEAEAAEWATRKVEIETALKEGKLPNSDKALTAAQIKDLNSEYKYKTARAEARADRVYEGSLIKDGNGTLTLAGSNTYRGGTTVVAGKLVGLTQSFGTGDVNVENRGTLSIVPEVKYLKPTETKFTEVTVAQNSADRKVNAVIKVGGTLAVGNGVELGTVKFEAGSFATAEATHEQLMGLYADPKKAVESVATGTFEGTDKVVGGTELAFFKADAKAEAGKLTVSLKRGESMASVAQDANGAAIGAAIESAADSDVFAGFIGATRDQALATYASLSDDLHLAADNASVVNAVAMTRVVKDQAMAIGEGRKAELDNGITIWATGTGNFAEVDSLKGDVDVDHYAGLFGADKQFGNTRVGLFFGAGSSEFKGETGKVESDDLHFGVYGHTDLDKLGLGYGIVYTTQDRDASRALFFADQAAANKVNYDTTLLQVYAEASYKGFNTDAYSIEPYVGFDWIHVKGDNFTESVGTTSFGTDFEKRDIQVANVGVRYVQPFALGSADMKFKGDLAWNQYFGDTEGQAALKIGDAGTAVIEGEEISGAASVGLGIDANIGKNVTFGVSYTGTFGNEVTAHGFGAKVNFLF